MPRLNQKTTGPVSLTCVEDMLKSAIIEEKKFKNTEYKWFGTRSKNDLDLL